ncbi:MAG: PepSY domain-containing protein [Magnetococcales bacterium]|nr:PepSY domain-containing protein [Magnetococcales bacterium]
MNFFPVFIVFFILFAWTEAIGDPNPQRARQAVDSGDIVGLEWVLERARTQFPGHILKVELEDEEETPSGWIYEVKILQEDGSVIEVEYDAETLEVLDVEGKDLRRRRHSSK